MRKPVIYSAALHFAVITVAYFGVPSLFRPPPVVAPPIAVELVTEEPPKKAKPKAPKPKPPKPAPKSRPPRAEAPPEPPPAPELPPPQTALAKPAPEPPPPPKAKPKPKPKAEPAPAPKQVAAPPPRPRPAPPKPKAKPKPKPDQFQALLKNLAKQRAAREREQKQAAVRPEPAMPRPVPTPRRSALEARQLENILIAAVRQQLSPCWNIPAGAKDAREMRVGIRIRLQPDGTLRGAPVILDPSRLTDPFYRAVAESAVRALYNPQCRPLRLPLDQYDIWKDITFNFDPGEALDR